MTAGFHGERAIAADDRRARRKPALGLVGPDLDVQLTAYAVGTTDAADDDQHDQR
jgi:hypothetical protein